MACYYFECNALAFSIKLELAATGTYAIWEIAYIELSWY